MMARDAQQVPEGDTTVQGDALANPLPLGWAALALSTAVFGAYNAGHFGAGSLAMAGMLLFYGGIAQFLAAILAFRNRDTMSLTVFGSFSAFYLALGAMLFTHDFGRA